MKHNELIKFCRYYKGQKEPPDDNPFFGYEKAWVELTEKAVEKEDAEAQELLSEYVLTYLRYGLQTFQQSDGVPATLKALLLDRYLHWLGGNGLKIDADGFKRFYMTDYINK